MFLVPPRPCKLQPDVMSSHTAVLECGLVAKRDMLIFGDWVCGEVLAFFLISDIHFVEIRVFPAVDGDMSLRDTSSMECVFKECRYVVDACVWHATETEHIVRVCIPPILELA